MALDLQADPVALCAALVDVPSVSGDEGDLADLLETALREQAPHLEVLRSGAAVLARTNLGRERRIMLAGHIDTVPIADNVPSRREGELLYGCGTSDMKAGDAVFAHLAATLDAPRHDLTLVFYDCEEIEAVRNGLGRIEREHRDWLDADLAILGEPTNGAVEAGCQGTLKVEVTLRGRRAHSARSWLGDNAVHAAGRGAAAPRRLPPPRRRHRRLRLPRGPAGRRHPGRRGRQRRARRVRGAGELPVRPRPQCRRGGGARPASCSTATTCGSPTPRRARSPASPSPRPRSSSPPPARTASAKYGWTDVSRFAALGIPALNYGPGDPNLAHTRDEHVDTKLITSATEALRAYLGEASLRANNRDSASRSVDRARARECGEHALARRPSCTRDP